MNFAQRVIQILNEQGISRKQFYKDLHFGKNQIRYWELHDIDPRSEILGAILRYLNISADYLKSKTNIKNPPSEESEPVYLDSDVKFILDEYNDLSPSGKEKLVDYLRYLAQKEKS